MEHEIINVMIYHYPDQDLLKIHYNLEINNNRNVFFYTGDELPTILKQI